MAASSSLDVDQRSSADEMERGFDALRKHLAGCVGDLEAETTSARATQKMVVAILSELTDRREVDEKRRRPKLGVVIERGLRDLARLPRPLRAS